jgi:hypothetical protein
LREQDLTLLEADKTSTFVVIKQQLLEELSEKAFEKSFETLTRNTTVLTELREDLEGILKAMQNSSDSYSWYNRVKGAKGKYLRSFSKYKTHKKEGGLRMIVDESETFQN